MKSVVGYFQEKYTISIKNTHLPCLQVGNQKRPIYLPMEVCKIVEEQRYSKTLNDKQKAVLLNITCQRPKARKKGILQAVQKNAYNEDPYAEEFGIRISDRLASVEAQVLPAPKLKYHNSGVVKLLQPSLGQWNMKDKKMVDGANVKYWACINFSNVQKNDAAHFCQEIAKTCKVYGMNFVQQSIVPLQTSHPDQVESALKYIYGQAKEKGKELELLIAILPDNNGSLYGDLKRICETDIGIVSQCCKAKYVPDRNRQYMANLALKINAKVGGRNTALVDLNKIKFILGHVPTIIFGADVTHPHPGDDTSPSIAAVVASHDWPEFTKYVGRVSAQAHRQEIIADLYKEENNDRGMIRDLLRSFYTATQLKPKRIIFYRDGVSEGQFYQVLQHELDAINKACASLEKGYKPLVTFIIVQKRHHTRLFADDDRDMSSADDQSGNVLPGTVVDSKICHPSQFDFYLCSHPGVKGTSRPAHYHVLCDENKFSANALQTLTNDLCYIYAGCTRAISIVLPAYYAHLAAFRARFYMQPETSDSRSLHSGHPGRSAAATSSGTSSTRPGTGAATVQPLPAIKENLKRVMFYC